MKMGFKNYVALMVGLTILFYFTGLLENTASSTLLNLMLDKSAYQATALGIKFLAMLTGVSLAGVFLGVFLGTNVKTIAVSVFTIFLLSLLWDFGAVLIKVVSINPVYGILLFSPFMFLFIVAATEWWGFVSS